MCGVFSSTIDNLPGPRTTKDQAEGSPCRKRSVTTKANPEKFASKTID